jgi:Bacterial capsule synthesis protein PGA_cap
MIDAGADVIFDHHPHRLQPMDTYEGRPIFHGRGNFVWPSFSAEGSTSAVARVLVRRTGASAGACCRPRRLGRQPGPGLTEIGSAAAQADRGERVGDRRAALLSREVIRRGESQPDQRLRPVRLVALAHPWR